MIPENERQASIVRARAERAAANLKALDGWDALRTGIAPSIIELRRKSLRETLHRLRADVSTYTGIKSGEIRTFKASRIQELPDILKRARLAQGLTHRQFAERLGLKEQQIQRYEADDYQTVSLHRLYELFDALSIKVEIEATIGRSNEPTSASQFVRFEHFPYKEMARRGWIIPHDTAEENNATIEEYISKNVGDLWGNFLHRQIIRATSVVDNNSLLAWQARICEKARLKRKCVKGDFFSLGLDWVSDLVELSKYDDGPRRAVDYLLDIGVIVVVEPHLEKTHLDGAATILDGEVPVVGLTLRFDRTDNFWFVLLHEVGHLVLHAQFDEAIAFFDLGEEGDELGRESQADDFARTALIPDEKWKASLVRFAKDPDAVKSFASANGISASVVAGRIRRERRDFTIFSELVGQGNVRKQFDI